MDVATVTSHWAHLKLHTLEDKSGVLHYQLHIVCPNYLVSNRLKITSFSLNTARAQTYLPHSRP